MPLAFLERAGFAPSTLDLAVESLDEDRLRRARLVAVSVPMHTALRLALRLLDRLRALNPGARVVLHGLYAQLNRKLILERGAHAVLAGEMDESLARLAEQLEAGREEPLPGVSRPGRPADPALARLDFPVPDHRALPPLAAYAKLDLGHEQRLAAYTEASRGCRHVC